MKNKGKFVLRYSNGLDVQEVMSKGTAPILTNEVQISLAGASLITDSTSTSNIIAPSNFMNTAMSSESSNVANETMQESV